MSGSFISNIYTNIVEKFQEPVAKYAALISAKALPAIGAVFTCYMIYVIYRMYSKKDALFEEFIDKIILFALLGAFTATSGYYYSGVIPFVTGAGDDLATALSSDSSSSITAVDTVYNTFQTGIDTLNKFMDDSSWWNSFSGDNINAMIAMFFLYISQFLFTIVIAVNLLIAKIMVVMLLSVGIIFIAFIVFPATRNMFWSFLGLCFNYILLNVLYSVAAQLAGDYIISTYSNTSTAEELAGNAAETLVTVAIIILAVNQIPVLVSSLTGGVGISAFTVSSFGFNKLAGKAKTALFGNKSAGQAKTGLFGHAANGIKKAASSWKNRGSGSSHSS